MTIANKTLAATAAQSIVAIAADGKEAHAGNGAHAAGHRHFQSVEQDRQRTDEAHRKCEPAHRHAGENRNGRTPVSSGQRGMIGRPRVSISIGLPVRRDFSSARAYSASCRSS